MVSAQTNNGRGGRRRKGSATGSNGIERMRRLLLGIGFWVQGFRCFPWMGVNFFLKDGMKVDPSTLQILQNSANLPMVAKPIYGILSDSYYIFGQHRIPYIAFGAFLQAVSWGTIALFPQSSISFLTLTMYLLLSNLGASIAEVANDAMVAETGKEPTSSKKSESSSSGGLQSFTWIASSIGGVLGNLLVGIAIERYSPRLIFVASSIVFSLQFLVSIVIQESSLDLPKSPPDSGIRNKLSELLVALRKPEISCSIAWFAASYAVIPALTGTMFYYQTQHLEIDSSVLGISKVFGQAAMLVWGILYNRRLKSIPSRTLISAIQILMAIFMVSDVLFVKGVYRMIGFPDSLYVVVFSGLLEVLYFFKILPFSVLMAQLCPPGCEGSVMAFLTSAIALAFIVSGYLGVALASYFGVTGNDFTGFQYAVLVQAACTLVPLYWSSCIPDDSKAKPKTKES